MSPSKSNHTIGDQILETTIFQQYVEILRKLQTSGTDITHPKVIDVISRAQLFTFEKRRKWIKGCVKSNPLFRHLFREKAIKSIRAILKIEKKILKKIQEYYPKYGTITHKLQKIKIDVTEYEVAQLIRKNHVKDWLFPGNPTTAS